MTQGLYGLLTVVTLALALVFAARNRQDGYPEGA